MKKKLIPVLLSIPILLFGSIGIFDLIKNDPGIIKALIFLLLLTVRMANYRINIMHDDHTEATKRNSDLFNENDTQYFKICDLDRENQKLKREIEKLKKQKNVS